MRHDTLGMSSTNVAASSAPSPVRVVVYDRLLMTAYAFRRIVRETTAPHQQQPQDPHRCYSDLVPASRAARQAEENGNRDGVRSQP